MARQIIDENGGLALQVDLCLLICSNMFPEGSNIPIEDLAIIGMGLKLFEDVQDMIGARQRVLLLIEIIRYRHGINELRVEKDEYENQYVKMLVGTRNSKRLIALRNQFMFDRETIMEKLLQTTRFATKFESCRGLSLLLKRISEYPVNLNCPKLALLQIRYGEDSTILPADFFQGMKELRVLSLDVPSLPYPLDVLRNLRTLYLKVVKLKYMSVIGGLINLEFLSISTLSSAGIPEVMGQLENLRLLDVRKMNLAYISPGVFSRMSKLEELYLPSSFKRWGCREKEEYNDYDECESGGEDHYGNEERINASLSEILSLSLNALQICIPNASLLPIASPTFKNIRQFKILVPNNLIYRPFDKGSMNMLQLAGDACDIKESGVCNLMRRTGHLSLTRVKNLKNLVHQLEDYHFPWLNEMIITECDELEYLIDIRENCIPFSLFWELKTLHLSMLSSLKEIWRGPHIGWFQNLRQINIRFCHKLKYVFPMSMASELRNLHSIEILDCDEMEGIFKTEVDDYLNGFYCLEELYLYSLPKLVGFLVEKDCTKVGAYEDTKQSLTMNEVVSNGRNLEGQISRFGVNSRPTSISKWKNKLLLSTQNKQVSLIKNTDVISHMEMNCAFSSKLLVKKRLENLKKLKIAFCDAIKVIFSCKDKHGAIGVLNSLKELELFGLRNLVHIWFQVPSETTAFWNLQLLVLVDCHNLYLFSPGVANLLVQLQEVQISRCEKMEEIVLNENKRNCSTDKIIFHQLRALELQYMSSLRIFYGGICAIELPLLESLKLNQCNKMESFSYGSLYTPKLDGIQINGRSYSSGRDLNATMEWLKK
ncbi:uncharacterized protein [Euphorbia lathyris]|uniref:uncharacterized protein n=1 Tax=Euphorbia lathyris TaxID=212925 RepID=UPI00331406BD